MSSELVRNAICALPYTFGALLAYHVLRSATSRSSNEYTITRSPRQAVNASSSSQQAQLPYPPTYIPGARDIDTPYGCIRAYEFGPTDGEKVLLVHGISTPCIALASVAKILADAGHRVMLFDLFGRGYSDSPSLPQDIRLFTTQIQFVLAASLLHWAQYHLVGYSLGGGIAASFASFFPEHVLSLTLIAPAGLIREHRMGLASRLMKSGLLPDFMIDAIVKRRLLGGAQQRVDPEVTHPALKPDSDAVLYKDRPEVTVAGVVTWQVLNHEGFVRAFVSSIAHAPITNQHEMWRKLGSKYAEDRSAGGAGKLLLILGRSDDVIVGEELVTDAIAVLGEDGLQVEWLDAGHDVPIVKATEVARLIVDQCKRAQR